MRRHTPSFLGLVVLILAAALVPGAAVFAPRALASCDSPLNDSELELLVTQSSIIAEGTVQKVSGSSADTTQMLTLQPEAFLKGPSNRADIQIQRSTQVMPCEFAELGQGNRVIVLLHGAEPFAWPSPNEAYLLENSNATSLNPADSRSMTESEFVAKLRGMTGQLAVPAASNSEGASLDWVRVVLPTTIVVLIVFGIGLVLMRVWHRIDPT